MHMDADSIRSIAAGGETLTTEFKSDRSRLNDRTLVETVACMANGQGGTVLVGVEDDGTITGSRPRHGTSTDPALMQALIANLTVPPLSTTVDVVDVDGSAVIAVRVDRSTTPVGTRHGVYTRRALRQDGTPECVPYAFHEMFARTADAGQVDPSRTVLRGATSEDLDPGEFQRFREMARRSGGDAHLVSLDDGEIARVLGLIGPDGAITTGAMLLFGRAPSLARYVPTHEVLFQVVRNSAVESNVSSRAPLLAAADDLSARIGVYNREQELDAGLLRIAIPLVSPVALREVIANALVHRDYTRLGPVQVQLTDDALVVASPGGFPEGITLENYLRENRARSPLLADAFKRAGLVERSGRGINRMLAETIRIGRDAPDFSRTSPTSVVATFPLGDADLALARFVIETERSLGRPLPLADLQVLHELRQGGSLSVADASELLQQAPGETRAALGRMMAAGLVERRGSGRGSGYHLSAQVYRAIGDRAAYVRVHGFADVQVEQMVLTYARAHGRISRSEAAELCSLTPQQASTLLTRMAGRGLLSKRGERRGTHYVVATDHGD